MALPSPDPSGYDYRPLKHGDKGWDVFALQTALSGVAQPIGSLDGIFGSITGRATRDYQLRRQLAVDSIAGIATQIDLALQTIWPHQSKYATPPGLLRGQIEKESGFQLGNHSPRREDGTLDAGVCQRNTKYASLAAAYAVPSSVQALASQLRYKYDTYRDLQRGHSERRLWELAAGSWNAPAWTDRLAGGGTLSPAQLAHITAYIDRVTCYL